VALDKANDAALGPREDRTRDTPTWDGERYSGGLAFERNDRAKRVNEEGRTYTLANLLQKQKSWVGPCEGAKSFGGVLRLDKYVTVNFSGRRHHGSTPPLAPCGEKPVAWAYRLTVVSYPPERMTDGSSHFPVGALPNGEPFSVPPEAVMLIYVVGLLFPL
jgi:hypothetical protein